MKTKPGKDKMLTLVGKGVSPGLAKGTAFVYVDVLQRDSELSQIDPAEFAEEQARIERAIDDCWLLTIFLLRPSNTKTPPVVLAEENHESVRSVGESP